MTGATLHCTHAACARTRTHTRTHTQTHKHTHKQACTSTRVTTSQVLSRPYIQIQSASSLCCFAHKRAHSSCAQRSRGNSACRSLSSTVGPHQMQMPAGASKLGDCMSFVAFGAVTSAASGGDAVTPSCYALPPQSSSRGPAYCSRCCCCCCCCNNAVGHRCLQQAPNTPASQQQQALAHATHPPTPTHLHPLLHARP